MKLLVRKLGGISKTATLKDTVIVFSGQAIFTLISALFFLLAARALGPEKLGVYTTVAAIVVILTDTIDLALNSTIIKFINTKDGDSYIKFAFFLKICSGIFLVSLLTIGSGFISLFLHQELNQEIIVASIFGLVLFFLRFSKAFFQGKKKFVNDAAIDVGISIIRLLILLVFIFTASLTVVNIFWTHIIATFFVFLLAIKKISLKFLKAKLDSQVRKNFFSFQSWLTLGFVLAAIHSRIDTLFLMRLSGPAMVGFYQAGYRFFLPVIQFASVLSTVFAPRFASFQDEKQVKVYLKKASLLSAAFGLLTWIFIPFVPFAVDVFYGPAYKAAVLPTQIMSVGFGTFVFAAPFISCLLYRRGQTKIFTLLNLVQLAMLIVLDLVLIPRLGAVGAAMAVSLTLVIINLTAVAWVVKK